MKDKHGNFISRWVTYCHDPMGYRDFIHELRGTIWEEQLETLGGDDGKNVLKFVYTGWSGDKTEHQTNMKNTGVKKCMDKIFIHDHSVQQQTAQARAP